MYTKNAAHPEAVRPPRRSVRLIGIIIRSVLFCSVPFEFP